MSGFIGGGSGGTITSWESIGSITGSFTTNTTYSGRKRRVGDSLDMQVFVHFAGAPNAVNFTINMPDGLAVDETKLAADGFMGYGDLNDAGIGTRGLIVCEYQNVSNLFNVYYNNTTSNYAFVTQAAPITLAINDSFSLSFYSIPIIGW